MSARRNELVVSEVSDPSYSVDQLQKIAGIMAKSGFCGFRTIEEGVTLMLMAQAEGKHPVMAAQEYHVIKGRPALKADAMLARFQAAGGVVEWEDYSDEVCSANFSHPTACPKPLFVEWDMARAKDAGFTGKSNWSQFPRQMLKARVCSEGVRACYPGVATGVYTPEEVETFDPNGGGRDMSMSKSEQLAVDMKQNNSQNAEPSPPVAEDKIIESSVISTADSHERTELPVGNVFEVIDRIKRARTTRTVAKIASEFDKTHKFSLRDRKQIENAAEVRQANILEDEFEKDSKENSAGE